MNVLVTGGAGYIGSVSVALLLQRGHRVTVIDDLSSGDKERLVEGCKFVLGDVRDLCRLYEACSPVPDVVLHLAAYAWTQGAATSLVYYDNMAITKSLLEMMPLLGCKKIVFSSSCSVYGESLQPAEEYQALRPTSPYGRSKVICEWMIQDLVEEGKLGAIILRYANVAGAWGRTWLSGKTGLLLPRLVDCAMTGEAFEVQGGYWPTKDGSQLLDLVHVYDVVRFNVMAVESPKPVGSCFIRNVGTGEYRTIKEIAASVAKLVDEFPTVMGNRRPGESFCVMDVKAVKREWQPEKSLDDMILDQVEAAV